MGVYSKNDVLSDYIERAYVEFMRLKIPFDSATIKEINYGVSFKVGEGKGAVSVAVYHTERKGFSIVTSDPKIRSILLSLLTETGTVGNDEAGKGDLFGPLVVCSFLLGESESELLKLHVTDSKKLKDAEIISIYEQVQKNFPNSFAALRMMPEKFNKAFEVATAKNQNSNHILAWSHARTIERLLAKRRDAKRVLVDQFSESDFVNPTFSNVRLVEVTIDSSYTSVEVPGGKCYEIDNAPFATDGESGDTGTEPDTGSEPTDTGDDGNNEEPADTGDTVSDEEPTDGNDDDAKPEKSKKSSGCALVTL